MYYGVFCYGMGDNLSGGVNRSPYNGGPLTEFFFQLTQS